MAGHKDARQLKRRLEKQGAKVVRLRGGHYKVTNPETGAFAFMATSPGTKPQHDTLKRLRRLGYEV